MHFCLVCEGVWFWFLLVWFCLLSVTRAEVVSNVLNSGGCGVPHGGVLLEKLYLGPVATSSVNTKRGVFRQKK